MEKELEQSQASHPLEPISEASMMVNKKGHENTGDLLEVLIQQNEKNNPEPLLEANIEQSKKNTKEIIGVVKDLTEKLEPKELGDGATFIVKGTKGDKGEKGDKGDKGETGDKGDKGDTGETGEKGDKGDKGDKGEKGEDGADGLDGKDGKDGKDGAKGDKGDNGKDGESVPKELLKKIDKTLRDTEKNLLYVNNGAVKSVTAGSNITIDNSDPQNPVISSSSSGGTWGTITGTLSSQTDLQTALDTKVDENVAITGATKTKITYDAKGLVTSGADATTADIADSSNKRYVTDADLVDIGNLSGTNTGDQTSIVGITGTKAQFDTAVTDGNFLYVGDITQYTDELAQDAVGGMVNSTLTYVDGTPSLGINLSNANTWAADQSVPDEAYGVGWNGSMEVPTKNALYDKIETLGGGSGITRTIVTTSGSLTLGATASVDYVYFVAGAHTISMPSPNSNRYTIKNNHSAAITIDTAGAELIEGAASISLDPEDSVDVVSDSTNWYIV